MTDPEHGKVYQITVWEDRSAGRKMRADPWTDHGFPQEMTVGGEGCPVGVAVAVGNSHNIAPQHTLRFVLRDPINGFDYLDVPFGDIEGGYSPQGAAHWLLHRDWPWQDRMLKVLASCNGTLVRVYTWWYLVERNFRWDQPDQSKPGRWLPS